MYNNSLSRICINLKEIDKKCFISFSVVLQLLIAFPPSPQLPVVLSCIKYVGSKVKPKSINSLVALELEG